MGLHQAAERHLLRGCVGTFQSAEWALVKWLTGTDEVVDQFSQHHLLKRLSFLRCIFLPPLSKIRCPSVQFSSVTQSCPTLCNTINRSTPGLPVHHQLTELTQTHVHRVSDAIQPSHPLLSPYPLAPNPSRHQSLFQWVSSSHEVAKVLEFQL